VVDNFQTSSEFEQLTTTRLERVDGGGDEPDWLTVRRQHLDNQVLRRQLRCQRAEALVSQQFNVILRK